MKSKQHKKIPVPKFANYEEEAHFWDTHDFTEVESRPVTIQVAKNLSSIVTVRFEGETLTKLEQLAEQRGLGTATMIRMWVMERLNTVPIPTAHK